MSDWIAYARKAGTGALRTASDLPIFFSANKRLPNSRRNSLPALRLLLIIDRRSQERRETIAQIQK